ncbi:MAG: phosphoglucomutase/phosphomannomutase family protein [Actinomycetia bacterium]|nr:phosphoglucomutase/phosphomannomutase family protein [Actinomycetes bacterium]
MNSSIKFGTDGWRSVIAQDFTFDNVGLVTRAICRHLKSQNSGHKGIFIGYDNRFLSEDFAQKAAGIIADEGIKVFLSSESVPTPVTAFMVRQLDLDGALMFTASHNPPRYNGIKFIPHYAGPADEQITGSIEKHIGQLDNGAESLNHRDRAELVTVSDFHSYVDKLLELVDTDLILEYKPAVAADTMYGSGSRLLPEILNQHLELNATVINNFRDPLFGGKLPEPSKSNLTRLYEIVKKENLDIGIALDGDADRFGVIDARGEYISPNNVISIILFYLTETGKFDQEDMAVRTVATTHLIDEICKKKGLKVKETPVGFKHIGKAMLEEQVLIGGEESGGLSIKGHIPEKDGLLANLLLLEIQSFLKKNRKGPYLSDYLNEIYNQFGTFYNLRLDLEIPQNKKSDIIKFFRSLKDADIGDNRVTEINTLDGVKLILKKYKGWLLIRPSGTEPLIRCYIETTDQNDFNLIKNFVEKKINNLIK